MRSAAFAPALPGKHARQHNAALAYAGIASGAVLLAVLFGLVAVTANPIFIGLAVGLLAGVLLLGNVSWTIWSIFGLGLFVVGVLPLWVEGYASKAVWGVSLLGLLLLAGTLLRALANPAVTRGAPPFVWLALSFLIYASADGLAHWGGPTQFFSGFKSYFQVFGLIFALAWLRVDEGNVRQWRKLFVILALVQLPWAIYELIWLVPIREGLRHAYPLLVPIDVVAGTFGASLHAGGANGEMAAFLIIALVFLLARWREKALTARRVMLFAPIILAPLFMGETKAVVVMLPLAFATLYRRELLARPHYALAGLLVGALLTVAAGYAYLSQQKKTLEQYVAGTLSYNVYEGGYGGRELNRTTVLTFWAKQHGLHDPVGTVFGHGLGSTSENAGGQMARRYAGKGIGLTAASRLLWEQGLGGMLLFLSILLAAWRAAGRLWRQTGDAAIRADAAAIQAALPVFAFFLVYRAALVEGRVFQIVFAAMLGYLAWLCRQQADAGPGPLSARHEG
ncbi:MAG: hypothetical protein OHM77_02145 [Candidatus Nitricoxidivorans perseverans]|uniref:O-antigen ligase domain-containing protein n=1 Tax=Candidatus Nitricoxidivorans perseverans TaxID=2975601 RepID=A0AA49IWI3_9PROT|nr:MAG: hypothetical protein OHM77_02145 [Candidatus Nitricoxidivorans perseverans]